MAIWNLFKKSKPGSNLSFFQVTFPDGSLFCVSAASALEAEELVCAEIFHNQTIPGLPEVEALTKAEVKDRFPDLPIKKIREKGIWHPGK